MKNKVILMLTALLLLGCSGEREARTTQRNNNQINIGDVVVLDAIQLTGVVKVVMERIGDGHQWLTMVIKTTNSITEIEDVDVSLVTKVQKLEN